MLVEIIKKISKYEYLIKTDIASIKKKNRYRNTKVTKFYLNCIQNYSLLRFQFSLKTEDDRTK